MPIRKHEPVSKEAMHVTSPNYTICEVLREIYWLAEKAKLNPEELPRVIDMIQYRARVATSMGKAMTAKLEEYKARDGQTYIEWDKNPLFPGVATDPNASS